MSASLVFVELGARQWDLLLGAVDTLKKRKKKSCQRSSYFPLSFPCSASSLLLMDYSLASLYSVSLRLAVVVLGQTAVLTTVSLLFIRLLLHAGMRMLSVVFCQLMTFSW